MVANFAPAGSHPAFFTGEVALADSIYYLVFPNGHLFGPRYCVSNRLIWEPSAPPR